MRTIEYSGGVVHAIDQTLLPAKTRRITLRTTAQLREAIRALRIRGAPMLGIAGAMGVAQAARAAASKKGASASRVLAAATKAGSILAQARPTAVNLGWAIDRALARAAQEAPAGVEAIVKGLEDEAAAILDEDAAACRAMADAGQEFVEPGSTIVTHCNTGSLCTGGYGTAIGVIRLAHEQGKGIAVLAGETRPLLQGARLTAWELGRIGVPYAIVPDGAVPALISRGEASLVVVGADRIAANGDVANKIGTFSLALAAKDAGIPFVVVAPTSTVDVATKSGDDIEIEDRSPREVTRVLDRLQIAPTGASARNPAFDVTPARLITAIVTERGIARAPYRRSLAAILRKSS